jgi:FkbM family methyltransferase
MRILTKFRNLCEIASHPDSIRLKLKEPTLDLATFRLCVRLRNQGINPSVIFDVGANAGQFAIAATTIWPSARILSYEPQNTVFGLLEAKAKEYPRIEPRNMALGAKADTEGLMHITNQPASSSMLPLGEGHKQAEPGVSEVGVEHVQVSTLEDEIVKVAANGSALLKMDVQGYEQNVLIGARDKLRFFNWIVFETSCFPLYKGETTFAEISDWLRTAGFSFYAPIDIHFADPAGRVRQFEALFYKLVS